MIDFTDKDGVVRIAKAQLRQVQKVFSEAFADYSLLAAFFPDKEQRVKKAPYFFRFVLNYGMKYGLVLATQGIEGAAILIPPDKIKMTAWRMFLSGVNIFSFRVGIKNAIEVGRICDSFYVKQKELAPYPHWYLMFIAVKPSLQGKGVGKKLLSSVLRFTDEQRLPLYLETQCADNVEIYEKLGFRTLGAEGVPERKLSNYCMIRNARN